jgi:hypothetical protein
MLSIGCSMISTGDIFVKVRYVATAFLFQFLLFVPAISRATELREETLKVWDEYVHTANVRMERRIHGDGEFLWIDEVPGRAQRVREGQIVVAPADSASPKVPHALIHDWVGAVFIPEATIDDVFAVVNDYDRYHEIYKPAVIDSKLLESLGSERKFSMVMMQRVLSVTAAVDGEYRSGCSQVDAQRWYCISYSTCLREIKNFSQANERELPPDQGNGYVWRLYSITRFQQRDGGVYAEVEAIGLSRDIPAEIRWLVKPIVERLPRNAVSLTLEQTRNSVRTTIDASRESSRRPGAPSDSCNPAANCEQKRGMTSAPEALAHRSSYVGAPPMR